MENQKMPRMIYEKGQEVYMPPSVENRLDKYCDDLLTLHRQLVGLEAQVQDTMKACWDLVTDFTQADINKQNFELNTRPGIVTCIGDKKTGDAEDKIKEEVASFVNNLFTGKVPPQAMRDIIEEDDEDLICNECDSIDCSFHPCHVSEDGSGEEE